MLLKDRLIPHARACCCEILKKGSASLSLRFLFSNGEILWCFLLGWAKGLNELTHNTEQRLGALAARMIRSL